MKNRTFPGNEIITVNIYHGGKLIWLPETKYVGGQLSVYNYQNIDELSMENLTNQIKAFGYSDLKCLYYRKPEETLGNGLVLLMHENEVIKMKSYARKNKNMIDLYLKHTDESDLMRFEDENVFVRSEEGNDINNMGDESGEINDSDFADSEYSMSDEDDREYANNIDEGIEWVGRLSQELGLHTGGKENSENSDDDFDSDGDSLESFADSIEEFDAEKNSKKKSTVYKEEDNDSWQVGMLFTDHNQCREAIRKHSYTQGRVIKFAKSDRTRVRAVCKSPCPWFLFASINFDKSFQLKKVGPDHTCVREQRGLPLIHSGFLADKYLDEFRINPSWPIESFHKTVMKDFNIDFKPHVLRRAKRKCLRIINGTHEEQYAKLWDYKTELLKRNPNSTVEMEFEIGSNGVFKRIYICFAGVKHGFKQGCRQVVGLDGCHIKNHYKGQLLVAVGVDPNNSMFPIAYAVVEAERSDTWRWFLELLIADFDMGCGKGWTLMSDRQKGLLNVVEEKLPMAEHRFCVRHMHNNFKQRYKGRSLKDKLWACARATNVESFTSAMQILKDENVGAAQWLSEVSVYHWSRSHFMTQTKCDILLNNMCESFNRSILWPREQGILVMLELIREYLMKRLQTKREKMKRWEDKRFTPKTYILIEKFKKWSGSCYTAYAGYNKFEVTTVNGSKFAVNLEEKTCGCRRWDLIGIPCHHVISCLNRLDYNVDDYVDHCYTTANYKKTYSGIIYPMNGYPQWEHTGHQVKPPHVEKQPGRPKKKRKQELKDQEEIEAEGVKILTKRNQPTVRCGNCKVEGHNKRTCPNRLVIEDVNSTSNIALEVQRRTDEEELQAAFNDVAMEVDLNDGGPPMSQPSQTDFVNYIIEPSAEVLPIQIVATKISKLKCARKLQNPVPFTEVATDVDELIERKKRMKKEFKEEEVIKIIIKKEMNERIKKGKQIVDDGNPTAKKKTPWNPSVKVTEKHNTHTGPMIFGKSTGTPVKQFKTIVGGTCVNSAPFLKHGKNVITKTALTEAIKKATSNLGKNAGKEKDVPREKDNKE